MGEQAEGQPPTPEARAAFERKLELLEALGVPTAALRVVLEERPQDFEREAEAAMRRELMGAESGPEAGGPPEEPVRISGGAGPGAPAEEPATSAEAPSPLNVASLEESVPAPAAPPAPPPESVAPEPNVPESPAPELPPAEARVESIDDLEAKLAAYISEAPAEPPPAPAPLVLEEDEGAAPKLEAEVAAALDEALAEAPPPAEEAPPLASGDSLSLEAPGPSPPPSAAAAPPGAKPPPPTGRAPPPKPPERVVIRAAPPPLGVKPAPVAAASTPASEILPTETRPRGRFARSAAGALAVIVVLAATYFFLINTAPVPAFSWSPSSPLAGEPVLFSANATTDPNGDPISFRWQFGDGTPNASGPVVSHAFPRSGSFTVTLTVTDDQRNSAVLQRAVSVAPGQITPPAYRYGDRLDYTVEGRSHVAGAFAPLATVNFTFGPTTGSCDIDAVDLNFEGPQSRSVLPNNDTALDGFLDSHDTYVVERALPTLQLLGQINVSGTCPVSSVAFAGSASILDRAFVNPVNNDTVRGEGTENVAVTIETDPPRVYDSTAALTDFPALANASEQLHFESVYAGRQFSTEAVASGEFTAEGLHWLWITQGTSIIGESLAIKIHFAPDNLPPASIYELTVDLWVSSASSLPLREFYHVRGVQDGKEYDSTFSAVASSAPTAGTAAIPFATGPRNYRAVDTAELAPLAQVPRSSAGPDFNFTARTAFDEGFAACSDVRAFMAANPYAYAVNATYGRPAGNPKWTIDLAQDASGESKRIEDEHSTAAQISCPSGAETAKTPLASLGPVVSLDYAAALMEREATAAALFPAGAFDALRANFTVRQQLHLPSVSLNSALSATRGAVPYAFGAESLPSQTERITAYVDAQTGQLVFVLRDRGDRLP